MRCVIYIAEIYITASAKKKQTYVTYTEIPKYGNSIKNKKLKFSNLLLLTLLFGLNVEIVKTKHCFLKH